MKEVLKLIKTFNNTSRKTRVAFVRDTSGSMFDESFLAFQKELADKLAKTYDVFIMDCDTEVRQQYKYEGKFKQLMGGGGTLFDDAFKQSKDIEADWVICATDLYCMFPDKEDVGELSDRTIWVSVTNYGYQHPFGKHVIL